MLDVPLMRGIRRRAIPSATGTFNPTSLPNLYLWHDASQIAGKNDGDALSQWDDSSGNARHATQPNGTQQPLYKTGIQNGLPAVYCDGSNDYLASPYQNSDASVTWYVAGRFTGSNSVSDRLMVIGNDNASIFYWTDKYGYYQVDGGNGNFSTAVGPTTSAVLTMKYTSASAMTGYLNGTSKFTGDPDNSYQTGSNAIIFGAASGGGFFAECYLYEFLLYGDTHSDTDRQTVERYIGAKWGITVA